LRNGAANILDLVRQDSVDTGDWLAVEGFGEGKDKRLVDEASSLEVGLLDEPSFVFSSCRGVEDAGEEEILSVDPWVPNRGQGDEERLPASSIELLSSLASRSISVAILQAVLSTGNCSTSMNFLRTISPYLSKAYSAGRSGVDTG
jgi:hypothetical protein